MYLYLAMLLRQERCMCIANVRLCSLLLRGVPHALARRSTHLAAASGMIVTRHDCVTLIGFPGYPTNPIYMADPV